MVNLQMWVDAELNYWLLFIIRVLLTSVSGALVKKPKSSKFYIEKNITYTLEKLVKQVSKQFYYF
jgi:hypothetical protein